MTKREMGQELRTLREMLRATAGRTIARDLTYQEVSGLTRHLRYSQESGVLFTDGARLVCAMDEGFTGSDVTGPDPVEIVYILFATPPSGGTATPHQGGRENG